MCILAVFFSVMKCLHMSFVDFFYSFVCTLVSSITVEFVFQIIPATLTAWKKASSLLPSASQVGLKFPISEASSFLSPVLSLLSSGCTKDSSNFCASSSPRISVPSSSREAQMPHTVRCSHGLCCLSGDGHICRDRYQIRCRRNHLAHGCHVIVSLGLNIITVQIKRHHLRGICRCV